MEKFSVKKIIGEVLGTLALVLVGAGSSAITGDLLKTALAFGLSVVVLIGLGFGITGGSLNPARSLGPALLQGGVALEMVWVYLVGPLAGGALAALLHKVL